MLVLETGFAIVAFINLVLNLILPEEIEDEETPELTANEVEEPADGVDWQGKQEGVSNDGERDVEGVKA